MPHVNVPKLFLFQANRFKSRTALKVKQNGRYESVSWHEFSERVAEVSYALSKLEICQGSRVALLSENRPEWAYVDLASLGLGAILVPIYATSSAKEVEYVVEHSGAEILFVSTLEQLSKTVFLTSNCQSLKTIVLIDSGERTNDACLSWSQFLEAAKLESRDSLTQQYAANSEKVKADDLATIIYTSGTTGHPKGVMLTHRNFLINCADAAKAIPMDENDVTLSFLPLSHVFERMAGYYYPIHQGATICYAESMNTVSQNLLEVQPTIACAVPRFYEKICAKVKSEIDQKPKWIQKLAAWAFQIGQKVAERRLSGRTINLQLRLSYAIADRFVFSSIRRGLGGRLRFFISGGAPLSKSLGEFFYAAGILILEGYGLTETSPVVAVNQPNKLKFGTVGPLFEHVQVKIADDGEILVSGPSVMKGYYQNEQATKEVIQDGWFRTGDIGEIDADGFLKITDRKKELIVTSGGKKVSPQNVENLLCSSRLIKQAVVIGDKHNYLVALIVPNFDLISESDRTNERMCELIRCEIDSATAELSNYEKIKYFRLLPKEMTIAGGELTPTLKVKRRTVQMQYEALIAEMYAEGERNKSV